ncbi:hypothetical protein NQ317_001931 [Molorchus minor]|uniref:ZAD domain-containing protein n=1 Tax=Molorchus minor TaxID=1323400 RepID=A0ABQ9JF16_9CUCU|nr:hypothetical protein NQ317_001931 [Molorchus minor]
MQALPTKSSYIEKPVICKKCLDDVKMAFDFKSTCLFTEELVISFARDQQTSHFELKDIYKEHKSLDYNIVELLICRYCVGSLVNYLKFETVCATTEETITKYCGQIDTNDQDPVELNGMFCNENECENEVEHRN